MFRSTDFLFFSLFLPWEWQNPLWRKSYWISDQKTRILSQKNLFRSVQSISCVWHLATPWIAACQASLSITSSWSSLKLTSIESVMPSSHLLLCCPLLFLPLILPSIRVFSSYLALPIKWPKNQSFSISPSSEYSGLISFWDWLVWSSCCSRDCQESSPAPQFKSINS